MNATDEPVLANYEILGELGRGGMGVVYRARDRRRDQVVALKIVQRAAPAALLRFKQEFRTLADVSHPNLVTLYELASDGRSWFFTMELIDGVDILTYVRSPAERMALDPGSSGSRSPEVDIADTRVAAVLTEPHAGSDQAEMHPGDLALEPGLSPSQLGRLRASFMQLAEGVDALHDAGKLHRDIKPSNVLVTRRGRVVLLDFGLAAELEPSGLHQSSEPHILGTIAYMAPEQAACLPVSQASDWYSVGVMLYETLTGRLPFVGRPLDVLMEKQRRSPSPPREIVADVPADLGELCAALLHRDPEARPDGAEVLRRLRARPPGVPAPSPTRRAVGTTRPFVGRAHHLAALSNAYSVMKQSGTVLVLAHGRSGVGKTALVQRFVESLPADDRAVVLPSRCYAQESVPYKALDGVIDSLGRTLRRLPATDVQAVLPRDFPYLWQVFPTLRLVEGVPTPRRRLQEIPDPRELRRRCVAALRDLLGRLSDCCPLVLVIDDLQWGDHDSAAILADLLQPPDPPALLLVGCYRREDAGTSPFLTRLRGAIETPGNRIDCRELAVDELAAEDAAALARSLYGPSLDDPAQERGRRPSRGSRRGTRSSSASWSGTRGRHPTGSTPPPAAGRSDWSTSCGTASAGSRRGRGTSWKSSPSSAARSVRPRPAAPRASRRQVRPRSENSGPGGGFGAPASKGRGTSTRSTTTAFARRSSASSPRPRWKTTTSASPRCSGPWITPTPRSWRSTSGKRGDTPRPPATLRRPATRPCGCWRSTGPRPCTGWPWS